MATDKLANRDEIVRADFVAVDAVVANKLRPCDAIVAANGGVFPATPVVDVVLLDAKSASELVFSERAAGDGSTATAGASFHSLSGEAKFFFVFSLSGDRGPMHGMGTPHTFGAFAKTAFAAFSSVNVAANVPAASSPIIPKPPSSASPLILSPLCRNRCKTFCSTLVFTICSRISSARE